MSEKGGVHESAIFSSQSTDRILGGLEGDEQTLVANLIETIRTAGAEGDVSAVRMAKKVLDTVAKVSYGSESPKWMHILYSFIMQLEKRMEQSGVSRIRTTVAGALPQAATWEPDRSYQVGARAVGIEEGAQAAVARDQRWMNGATAA